MKKESKVRPSLWQLLTRYFTRGWITYPPANQKPLEESKVSISSQRDAAQQRLLELLAGLLTKGLNEAKTPPILTVNGRPNEDWIIFQGYCFPELTREDIEARLKMHVAEEEATIDAFMNNKGGQGFIKGSGVPQPQLKAECDEIWIKLFNEWRVYKPSDVNF